MKKQFKRIATHIVYESDHVVATRTAKRYEQFLVHKDFCKICQCSIHPGWNNTGRCYEGDVLWRQAQEAATPREIERVYA